MKYNQLAEQSVIGILLVDGNLYKDLKLDTEHFYLSQHQIIFDAIKKVDEQDKKIDLVTVTSILGEAINEVGGVSYLSELAQSIASTRQLKHYESLVFESYRKRKTSELATEYTKNPTDENLHKLIDDLENVKEVGTIKQEKSLQDHLTSIVENMSSGEVGKGIKSNYTDLDNKTGGFQAGELIIVAARPSMGKTALALNLASNHCRNNGESHLFSLEMSTESLLQRVISSEAQINGMKWRTMGFSSEDYTNAMNVVGLISEWHMHIYDQTRSINDVVTTVRNGVNNNPNNEHLVIIDYLQLLDAGGRFENRNLEVGAITRELKLLAMELNIPIILLSQLSRAVEQRQDKRPMLSDLRDSGNIEQDADVVAFLYRDDYYNDETDQQNIIEIILSKQRNGPTGTIELAFMKEFGRFLNLDYRYGELST